jgi:signal peptidase II
LSKFAKDYSFLFLVAGFIYVLDQATKVWVRTNIPLGDYWSPWAWLTPYARLVHISNTGAAFGMLQGFSDVFTILSIIVAGAIFYYFPKVPREDWILRLAMGLQFGGALGNLTDRLYQGHVTDFISVGTFAVFNIADAAISTGVGILILGIWFKERENKATPPPSALHTEPVPESISASPPEDTRGE